MKRRDFFGKLSVAASGLALGSIQPTQAATKISPLPFTYSAEGHHITYHLAGITEPVKILHITDTHLWMDDERGIPYKKYSDRMAKAYNSTQHFLTGAPTNPAQAFEATLQLAQEKKADAISLVGDIFSFPSEAAIEWALEKLEAAGIAYFYTAGNHDWHYEGMEGSLAMLREKWTEKRLKPLYQANDPLMAVYDFKGVSFLAIDNSHYEITKDQLTFFREQVQKSKPMALMVHIPLYAPGRPVSYGCGHPDWGAATDKIHDIERRPRWPESGHSKITMDFHREVFNAPNLMGIFAGHVHRQTMDCIKGIPQFLTTPNASGGYLEVDFLPVGEIDRKLFMGRG